MDLHPFLCQKQLFFSLPCTVSTILIFWRAFNISLFVDERPYLNNFREYCSSHSVLFCRLYAFFWCKIGLICNNHSRYWILRKIKHFPWTTLKSMDSHCSDLLRLTFCTFNFVLLLSVCTFLELCLDHAFKKEDFMTIHSMHSHSLKYESRIGFKKQFERHSQRISSHLVPRRIKTPAFCYKGQALIPKESQDRKRSRLILQFWGQSDNISYLLFLQVFILKLVDVSTFQTHSTSIWSGLFWCISDFGGTPTWSEKLK